MLKIGKSQSLKIVREADFGLYLTDGEEDVLLPNKYVPIGSRMGEEIEVFVYTDSEDRPVATTLKPIGEVGDLVSLSIRAVSKFGAFADIGLEKDLLIPFKEQQRKHLEGDKVLTKILLDNRTNRMIGVSKIQPFLSKDGSEFEVGEEVSLLIWTKTDLGYKAVVNQEYLGLLYANEVFESIELGDEKTGFIKKVREDGKLDVSLQKQGYEAVTDLSGMVLEKLKENGGVLQLGDKSDPQEIKEVLGISKKNFKKVIGGLYKEGLVSVEKYQVSLKE